MGVNKCKQKSANTKAAVAGTNVTTTAFAATAVGAIAVMATNDNSAATDDAATTNVAQIAHNIHTAGDVATAHNAATANDAITFAVAAIHAITAANADAGEDVKVVNCGVIMKSTKTNMDNVPTAHVTASPIDTTTAASNNTGTTTIETKINSIDITESLSVDGAVDAMVSATRHAKKRKYSHV